MANSTGRSKVSGHLELPKIIKEIKKFIKMEKFCIEVRGDEDDNMKEFFGKRIKKLPGRDTKLPEMVSKRIHCY